MPDKHNSFIAFDIVTCALVTIQTIHDSFNKGYLNWNLHMIKPICIRNYFSLIAFGIHTWAKHITIQTVTNPYFHCTTVILQYYVLNT